MIAGVILGPSLFGLLASRPPARALPQEDQGASSTSARSSASGLPCSWSGTSASRSTISARNAKSARRGLDLRHGRAVPDRVPDDAMAAWECRGLFSPGISTLRPATPVHGRVHCAHRLPDARRGSSTSAASRSRSLGTLSLTRRRVRRRRLLVRAGGRAWRPSAAAPASRCSRSRGGVPLPCFMIGCSARSCSRRSAVPVGARRRDQPIAARHHADAVLPVGLPDGLRSASTPSSAASCSARSCRAALFVPGAAAQGRAARGRAAAADVLHLLGAQHPDGHGRTRQPAADRRWRSLPPRSSPRAAPAGPRRG